MTTLNYSELAKELRPYFPSADVFVEGGAGPDCVLVVLPDDGRTYVIGDANNTWGATFYPNTFAVKNGQPRDGLDSHLPTTITDPWAIALNVAAMISRYELLDL